MECSRLDLRSNQLFLLDDVVKASFASAINQKQPIAIAIGCIPFCGEEGIMFVVSSCFLHIQYAKIIN